MGALDALLQQRRADGDLCGLGGAVLAAGRTDAEQRRARPAQDGGDIGEVHMDVRVQRDQIRDALHARQQRAVRGLERLHDADGAIGQLQQTVVRDDDQRIDLLAQVLDAEFCLVGTLRAFERERPRDHGDGQSPLLVRRAGHDRAGAGTGAAALAAGDEHHVGALEGLLDIRLMVLGGLHATLGIGTGAESTILVVPQRDLHIRIGTQQILGVGVDGHEFHVLQAFGDHAIDGVAAGSTDTDDLDVGLVVEFSLGDLAHHSLLSLTVTHNSIAVGLTINADSQACTAF